MDVHTKAGIKSYAKEHDIIISDLIESFLSALLWSKQAKKLKKLMEIPS